MGTIFSCEMSDLQIGQTGDSFSRIFSLVRHAEIGIKPYKGGSAKGLTKPGNTNREDIAKTLAQRPGTHTAVFVFGSVVGELGL